MRKPVYKADAVVALPKEEEEAAEVSGVRREAGRGGKKTGNRRRIRLDEDGAMDEDDLMAGRDYPTQTIQGKS